MAEHRSRFQSTHPRGVRHAPPGADHRPRPVSIHAPAWGATIAGQGVPVAEFKVSIHAPAWGATHTRMLTLVPVRVSIHAPAWGATAGSISHHSALSRFNPRTRVGCDCGLHHATVPGRVSIHAPAWGATPAQIRGHGLKIVSIHAPAWGATLPSGSKRS